MTFRGWPTEALEFYEGLEADNSKTYWQANKSVYEDTVLAPMRALLDELEPEFGSSKIFRPYRDVRFSNDKTPYKTAIGATLADGGYVHLDSGGLGTGSGMYHLAADQLDRFRRAVDDETSGSEVAALVAAARANGMDVAAHDVLKLAPKGYPKEHPRIDLLRQKGLITWQQWPAGKWLGTAKAKDRVVNFLRSSKPIMDWLHTNVGPSDLPNR